MSDEELQRRLIASVTDWTIQKDRIELLSEDSWVRIDIRTWFSQMKTPTMTRAGNAINIDCVGWFTFVTGDKAKEFFEAWGHARMSRIAKANWGPVNISDGLPQ